MRRLYEIDADIEAAMTEMIDPETGEVVNTECLDELFAEREQKIECVALLAKDVNADMVAIQNEIDALGKRKEKLNKTYESLKRYLAWALEGNKFNTPKCEITLRKSEQVEVDPDFCKWAIDHSAVYFVRTKESYEPNRLEIKKFLKQGGTLKHCRIVENKSITIK